MFCKIRNWLIEALGGVPYEEYDSLYHTMELERTRADTAEDGMRRMVKFAGNGYFKVEADRNAFCCTEVTALDFEAPIEIQKHRICEKLVEKILKEGFISFDVSEELSNHKKLYRGSITLIAPKNYFDTVTDGGSIRCKTALNRMH